MIVVTGVAPPTGAVTPSIALVSIVAAVAGNVAATEHVLEKFVA